MPYRAPIDDILFTINHITSSKPATTLDEMTSIFREAARLCESVIAPLNRPADSIGAQYGNGGVQMPKGTHEAYQQWVQAGWMGVSLPEEFGGAGLPTAINTVSMEMLTSACMALATLPVLSQGAVEAIYAHGSAELKQKYLPKLVSGEWTGTMNLTEPQAGTDLSLLRSKAVPQGDGAYEISGSKIFITFGEHDLSANIIHLVLARLPGAPDGTKGISLFLVPKFLVNDDGSLDARNNLRCVGIEHKLGIKASPTCTMAYEQAVGWLVGEANKGLACMFTMMNKARLATGLQGVAVAERAMQQALAYAHNRKQGRVMGIEGTAPISAHPDVKRQLARMRALTAGARALAYEAAAAIDAGDDARAGFLTPLVKAYCTEVGVEVASLNIQIHGGMGYIEETGAAQHWRDIRIAPIYEGTNAVQAIDLVMRKLASGGAVALERYLAEGRDCNGPLNETVGATRQALHWMMDASRTDQQKLYAASNFLRLVAVALSGLLLTRGAKVAGADPKWGALARVFAEDVAGEACALSAMIISATRDVRDYGRLI